MSRLRFASRTVRVCAAFLGGSDLHAGPICINCCSLPHTVLRVCVAVLLELAELCKPVETPCLRCNTQKEAWMLEVFIAPVETPRLWRRLSAVPNSDEITREVAQ